MAALRREEDAAAREAEHLEAEKLRHLRCACDRPCAVVDSLLVPAWGAADVTLAHAACCLPRALVMCLSNLLISDYKQHSQDVHSYEDALCRLGHPTLALLPTQCFTTMHELYLGTRLPGTCGLAQKQCAPA